MIHQNSKVQTDFTILLMFLQQLVKIHHLPENRCCIFFLTGMKPVAHPTEIQSNHVSRWDLLASLFLETKLWRYQFCIHRNSVSKEIRVKWPSGCSTFRGSFGSMQVPRYGRNFLDFLTYVQQTHRLLPKFLRVTNKVANSGWKIRIRSTCWKWKICRFQKQGVMFNFLTSMFSLNHTRPDSD